MAYGTVNADVIGTSVSGSNLGAGNASIMKNRIINGAMVIDQRNAGASVTFNDAVFVVDRFGSACSQASKATAQQSTSAPAGFSNSVVITSSSAYTVGATDFFNLYQNIEGFNAADLGWGTINAKTVTLSFWVQSSLTGTFGGSLSNSGLSRSYPFSYSIPSANTWTQISITIAGDTTGTWLTNNGIGLRVYFGLGVGSTYSGTAGTWAGTRYQSATGATSVVGTNGATFYITGVQLEVGSSATGYEYRQYGQELALCQRYYQTSKPTLAISAEGVTNALLVSTISYPVQMRSTPTISQSGVFGYELPFGSRSTQSTVGITFDAPTANNVGGSFTLGNFSSLTYSRTYRPDINTNLILLSAEL